MKSPGFQLRELGIRSLLVPFPNIASTRYITGWSGDLVEIKFHFRDVEFEGLQDTLEEKSPLSS